MDYRTFGRRVVAKIGRSLAQTPARKEVTPFCEEVPNLSGRRHRGKPCRVLVITQPKAGTYMAAEIFRQAGFHHTFLHLGARGLQAYDGRYLEESLLHPRRFDVACGIEESRKLVRLGEVAVSHIPHTSTLQEQLRGFKIVHIKRELRSMLRSWARMLLHTGKSGQGITELIRTAGIAGYVRHHGEKRIKNALAINEWSKCPNVFSIKMEQVLAEPRESIIAMLNHVDYNPGTEVLEIWERVKRAETLTKSSEFPGLRWTEKEETEFREIGGPEANKKLGYEGEWHRYGK